MTRVDESAEPRHFLATPVLHGANFRDAAKCAGATGGFKVDHTEGDLGKQGAL